MHVQGITTNSSPNFSALRIIKTNAERYISSMGKKTINNLDIAGDIIKDTKFYHLYIDKDVYIRHINGDRYYGPYIIQSTGSNLFVKYKYMYREQRLRLPFKSDTQAENAKNYIMNSETKIEETAKIVKFLDDFEKTKSKSQIIEPINRTDSFDEKINKLIKKYGV